MSVLPRSASFPSFFVVFAILLLFTILLGVNLKTIQANMHSLLQRSKSQQRFSEKLFAWTKSSYVRRYLDLLNPYKEFKLDPLPFNEIEWNSEHIWLSLLILLCQFMLFIILSIPFILLRNLPVILLRKFLLPEIFMPKDQYNLFLYRNNRYMTIRYHPVWFVKDVIRGFLIPAWIAVAAGIVCYLVIQDILWRSFMLVIGVCFHAR
jgi:hypothetical protein